MENYEVEQLVEDNYQLRVQNNRLVDQNKRLGEKIKAAMSVNDQLKEHNKTYLNEIAQLQAQIMFWQKKTSSIKTEPFYVMFVFVLGAVVGQIIDRFIS